MEGGVPGVPGVLAPKLVTLVQEVGQEHVTIHQQRMEGDTVLAPAAQKKPATRLLAL